MKRNVERMVASGWRESEGEKKDGVTEKRRKRKRKRERQGLAMRVLEEERSRKRSGHKRWGRISLLFR